MVNTINIVKKEIADIAGNRNVYFVILIYVLLIFVSLPDVLDAANGGATGSQLLDTMLGWVSNTIMTYGSIMAMMIGFSAITNEKIGNALTTLTTKPVYRDSIITGKILSCTSFMLLVFGLTTVLFTSMLLMISGNSVGPVFGEYMARLPFVFVLSSTVALIYLFMSILIPIWVKNHGVALLSTVVLFMMLKSVIPTVSFAGNLYILTGSGDLYDWIMRLCPDTAYVQMVIFGLQDPSISIIDVISSCRTELACLLLYVFILISLCYASFIRRDVV